MSNSPPSTAASGSCPGASASPVVPPAVQQLDLARRLPAHPRAAPRTGAGAQAQFAGEGQLPTERHAGIGAVAQPGDLDRAPVVRGQPPEYLGRESGRAVAVVGHERRRDAAVHGEAAAVERADRVGTVAAPEYPAQVVWIAVSRQREQVGAVARGGHLQGALQPPLPEVRRRQQSERVVALVAELDRIRAMIQRPLAACHSTLGSRAKVKLRAVRLVHGARYSFSSRASSSPNRVRASSTNTPKRPSRRSCTGAENRCRPSR